jgi:hypothetical protein
MIFNKEIFEKANLSHLNDLPTTNYYDTSCICQGKINLELYKIIGEYYSHLHMNTYVIYIPVARLLDHQEWFPLNFEGCIKCGEGFKLRDLISIDDKLELVIKRTGETVPIIPTIELSGINYGQIFCHALGVNDINEYKNKPIPSYSEAKELFPEGLNWMHIKIG